MGAKSTLGPSPNNTLLEEMDLGGFDLGGVDLKNLVDYVNESVDIEEDFHFL